MTNKIGILLVASVFDRKISILKRKCCFAFVTKMISLRFQLKKRSLALCIQYFFCFSCIFWCSLILSSVSLYVCVLIWQPLCVCPCLRARLEHCRRSARTRRSCWTVTLWTDPSTLWYQNSFSSSSTAAPRLGMGEKGTHFWLFVCL